MVHALRDNESARALDDQRRALVIAYAARLLRRSHRADLTMEESGAIARCRSLAEAMRVIEARRTPVRTGVRVESVPEGKAPRRVNPFMRVLREAIPYVPILWMGVGRVGALVA
jgi:hypothetical protein